MEVKCGASRGQETWDHKGLELLGLPGDWTGIAVVNPGRLCGTLAGGLSRAGIQKDRINHLHDIDVFEKPPSLVMELSRALRHEMSGLETALANQNRAFFRESRFLFHPCNFPSTTTGIQL
jgi:hypothetical protein